MKRVICFCMASFLFFLPILCISGETQFGNVYRENKNGDRKIALTFDDGPHPRLTPQILDILKRYGVHATFFLVGENVYNYPGILERILAEGHEIGNHTYTHGHIENHNTVDLKKEIEACESIIYETADYKTKLMRPPRGILGKNIQRVAAQLDYNIVLWNIDTEDWAHTDPKVIADNVVNKVASGSIILMHDYISFNSPTPEALELFIPTLLEQGYRFVVVSDLIYSESN